MRFLFNTVFYKPACGGGGPIHSVASLAEQLTHLGHEVTVVASDRDIPGRLSVDTESDHDVDGVHVRYFRSVPTLLQRTGLPMFARAGVFSFGPEYGSWLEDNIRHYNVVDSHVAFTCSNRLASIYAKRFHKPYLYHQRGNLDPVRLRYGRLKKAIFLRVVEKPIMRRADVLIALSEYEVKTFRALGLSNRIEIVPNGIDAGFNAKPDLELSSPIRLLLRECGEDMVFLFMSRVHPQKGPEVFVRAFLECNRSRAGVRAILAGPDETGMVAGLLHEVAQAGLADRFHYCGVVSGDDRLGLLRRADAFVLPTVSEGMSMALLEALACGCFVVTAPGAYFGEIERAGAGTIVPRSVTGFCSAMLAAAESGRQQLRIRGLRGCELVQRNYTWRAVAERYEALSLQLNHSTAVCV